MTSDGARRGARTGATIWSAVAADDTTRIAPDGVMDLLWHQGRLVVAGPDTRTSVAQTRPGEVTWGLQLAPGVAHAVLRVDADELTDRRVDLVDLVAVPVPPPEAFLAEPVSALERTLVALWQRARPERDLLHVAGELDRAARQGIGVAATAARIGLSPRSLQRVSNRLFGYGPKTLARIHRFQRGMRLLEAGHRAGDAAAAAGYADQSHFIRDARRLTGCTPVELARPVAVPAPSVRFVQS